VVVYGLFFVKTISLEAHFFMSLKEFIQYFWFSQYEVFFLYAFQHYVLLIPLCF